MQLNKNTVEIFQKVADAENLTISALEADLGASKGVLSRAKKNNTHVSMKWFQLLVEKYPHHDYAALIGTSPKKDDDSTSKVEENSEKYSSNALERIYNELQKLTHLTQESTTTLSRGMLKGLQYHVQTTDFIQEIQEAGAMDAIEKLKMFLNKEEL